MNFKRLKVLLYNAVISMQENLVEKGFTEKETQKIICDTLGMKRKELNQILREMEG